MTNQIESASEIATEVATEVATLGGGCFWCLEAALVQLQGVHTVVSGYAGGELENPSYRQICTGATGHAEVVQISFDPAIIDYRTLLTAYFTIHDPTTLNAQGNDIGTQYRSVIFTHSAAQTDIARTLIRELDGEKIWPRAIVTELAPAPVFWPAEIEHQDYFANNPRQPYCQAVVGPKAAKLRQVFATRLKR